MDPEKLGSLLERVAGGFGGLGELASKLAIVVQDPELRAELAERLKHGTARSAVDMLEREGRLTPQHAAEIRRKLGIES